MNARVAVIISVFVILVPLVWPAQEIEPEEAEEEVLEPSSERHKVTLRIKEQWSDRFTTNLYTAVARKDYFLPPSVEHGRSVEVDLVRRAGFLRRAQRPREPLGQDRAHLAAAGFRKGPGWGLWLPTQILVLRNHFTQLPQVGTVCLPSPPS